MESILGRYKKQLEEDRRNENKYMPSDVNNEVVDTYRRMYENELVNQRNDILSNEKQYNERMKKTLIVLHEDESSDFISNENIEKVIVKHFHCPECGEELIGKSQPMFNPFTMERVCLHECSKCGKKYNLDYSYPRFALINKDGIEIKAYGI